MGNKKGVLRFLAAPLFCYLTQVASKKLISCRKTVSVGVTLVVTRLGTHKGCPYKVIWDGGNLGYLLITIVRGVGSQT